MYLLHHLNSSGLSLPLAFYFLVLIDQSLVLNTFFLYFILLSPLFLLQLIPFMLNPGFSFISAFLMLTFSYQFDRT